METRFSLTLDPTKPLHVETLRLAVFSWAGARSRGGDLVLQMADGAVSAPVVQALVDGLTWLGLDWDEPERLRDLLHPGRDDPNNPITHVIINKNLLGFQNLEGFPQAKTLHLPPLLGTNGKPLPRRGYRLEDLQEAGYLPKALFNYLLLLGWSAPRQMQILNKWDVRQLFRWEAVSTQPVTFDYAVLNQLNQHYLQQLSTEKLADLLRPYVADAYGALPLSPAWLQQLTDLIRPELIRLEDVIEVAEWAFSDDFEMTETAKDVLGRDPAGNILTHLIAEIAQVVLLDQATAQAMLTNLSKTFGLDVVPFVRASLVGVPAGANLPTIMGLLGKQTTLDRLAHALRA